MESIQLRESPHGIILPVKAKPSASKNELRGITQGALKVAVTAAPEKGKANHAIIQLLAKKLRLRASQITLQSGETHSDKQFVISQISLADLRERLPVALD